MGWSLQNIINVLSAIELFHIKWLILCYMNATSINSKCNSTSKDFIIFSLKGLTWQCVLYSAAFSMSLFHLFH